MSSGTEPRWEAARKRNSCSSSFVASRASIIASRSSPLGGAVFPCSNWQIVIFDRPTALPKASWEIDGRLEALISRRYFPNSFNRPLSTISNIFYLQVYKRMRMCDVKTSNICDSSGVGAGLNHCESAPVAAAPLRYRCFRPRENAIREASRRHAEQFT